jgi:hypothetical protein
MYDQILQAPWIEAGYEVAYQHTCLKVPKNNDGLWDIEFPEVSFNDRSMVLMHCQDFLNVDDGYCRELDMIQQHFGDNAHKVAAIVWNQNLDEVYQGPVRLLYFPTHTYEILVNLDSTREEWQPQLLKPRTRPFQCLNGVPKKHRRRTVWYLDKFHNGVISLNPDRPIPGWPYYPNYEHCSNEENYIRLLDVYGSCDVNVVTETLYQHRPGIITEKTIFALLSLQVPLVIGYAGIVADIKASGFDVFDDIIDTGYDWMANERRIETAIESNRDVLTNGIDRNSLMPRLLDNQRKVLEWPAKMISHYNQVCLDYQTVKVAP